MARGIILKNNFTKETLLKIAGFGAFMIMASFSPQFASQIVYQYFKDKSRELARKRARKIKELQKRKLIEFRELSNGKIRVVLSHRGKLLVRQYKLGELAIKRPPKWDRYWRIIIYDIPHAKRKASNAFREKLRSLGLYQLQKSVWVSPCECLPEIEFLCSVFDIDMDRYVFYFKTKEIPLEGLIKKFFELRG
jgi:hypothetical protein